MPAKQYWENRYRNNDIPWDLGVASKALTDYTQQLANKNIRILIPGCGYAHEVYTLLAQGFGNITLLDISPTVANLLRKQFSPYKEVKVALGNFFTHKGVYDLLLEQTFFCAIDPSLRRAYADKTASLLCANGKLAGLFFSVRFDYPGPPYGGSIEEYAQLFSHRYAIEQLDTAINSHPSRQGKECFLVAKKLVA